ncbi:1-acyl-sn-glycerol-3-phosphate acyltransferase [Luteibacter sp. 22Crub2.1]|uniref:1-acyl-sn-glycerol-3-phosphate acyltransferase n=1 Tax=Luteibacter sp. 22Crub2.1 TaxID=1283288 RepID=UPI0009CBC76D|nr:1-acyl-sn-glycerol-3-phosphate acyltransferase [Luteibacter sp. 22Crub2.1]SKB85621.1 1-acyl-sn-glycerol-3-phosphate acyltransferase [Luteibacter sp. 22Crub2.1]
MTLPPVDGIPVLGPNIPQLPVSRWMRICRWVIKRSGWRVVGDMPNLPKVILIGAPHSSYWDGVWGLLVKSAMGMDVGVMIKREVLNGPLGPVVRRLGMIPIDRSAATNVVDQMVKRFAEHEKMWVAIAPEGTRKPVKQWKSGFLRIARAAGVPIQTVFIDYPTKTFTVGPLVHASGDMEADMTRIRAMFAGYRGKHRGV